MWSIEFLLTNVWFDKKKKMLQRLITKHILQFQWTFLDEKTPHPFSGAQNNDNRRNYNIKIKAWRG